MTEHNSAEFTQDTSTGQNSWQGCHTRNEESEGKLLGGVLEGGDGPSRRCHEYIRTFPIPYGLSFCVFNVYSCVFGTLAVPVMYFQNVKLVLQWLWPCSQPCVIFISNWIYTYGNRKINLLNPRCYIQILHSTVYYFNLRLQLPSMSSDVLQWQILKF